MDLISNAFDFLSKGGPVMVPLLLCSVVSIGIMIERYFILRSETSNGSHLMDQLEKFLAIHKYLDAVRVCENEHSLLGDMLASGLKCDEQRTAERCMEEHALKAMPKLYKRLSILDTIITIAPLLGLLGTVTGMIRAFHVISTKSGLSTPTAITGGVAEALIATATGLFIAIVTLVGYNFLTERAKLIVSDMEIYGTRLVNILSTDAEETHASKAMGA
jgi:biopolymer transport protein ExbB